MIRMRTITEAVAEIRAADPRTAFTEHALRRLIISGEIPHIMAGRKYLINLDALFEYLNGKDAPTTQTVSSSSIRQISERM